MIGFKGKFTLKQYLPGKPTKWGIKAWGTADSSNGYLLKCDIYKGKKETRDKKREYYEVGQSSTKWKFIFHFVINVCCKQFHSLRPE
jgi:hypothetical protein